MHYRRLGRTNLSVSMIGLGGGGQSRLGQSGGASTADVARLVDRAIDLGINLFDTAADYGTEEALGAALAAHPRDAQVVCTKFSPNVHGQRDLKPADALRPTLEKSLRQLRMDYVDVLYLHGVPPDDYTAIVDRFMPELQRAQADGLVRHLALTEMWGVDHAHEMLLEALPSGLWDVAMLGYNMLSPLAGVRVLPLAAQHNVGITVMCAVRTVISKPAEVQKIVADFKREGLLPSDALPDDAPLDWVLHDGVATLTQAAYKFAAEPEAVSCVLCGTGNPTHLEENVATVLGPPLPPATTQRLKDLFVPVGRNVGHGARR